MREREKGFMRPMGIKYVNLWRCFGIFASFKGSWDGVGHGCEGLAKRFSLKGSRLEGAEGALDTESKAASLGFRATTQYPVEYSRQDPFSLGPQAPNS